MKHAARGWIRRPAIRRCAQPRRKLRRIVGRAFRRDMKHRREAPSNAQAYPQQVLGSRPSRLVRRRRFRGSPMALRDVSYPSTLSSRIARNPHRANDLHFSTRQNSDPIRIGVLSERSEPKELSLAAQPHGGSVPARASIAAVP